MIKCRLLGVLKNRTVSSRQHGPHKGQAPLVIISHNEVNK